VRNILPNTFQSGEEWEKYMRKREETLRRKREAERRRQQRIKQNAEWLALEKYKKHLRYLKYKERLLSLKY
jgi:ATPase subunit of ABC transporter with duplicated ATPase domains